jgi:signal transduction histidine kinase
LYDNPSTKQSATFWRLIWMMPIIFFIIFLLGNNYLFVGEVDAVYFFTFRAVVYIALALICYLFDATLRKMWEAEAAKREAGELAEKNQFLESLSNMKSEYLSNLGHEMKTPLTVLSLNLRRASRLSAEGGDVDKTQKAHAIAIGETDRLIRMTEAALNLASIQESRGRMSDLNMAGLISSCAEAYRPLLEKNGNTLILNLQENLPLITGAPDLLAQVISNLMSNANAHTKNGEVAITAEADSEVMKIAVADNGEGVDAKIIPRVFLRGVSGRGSTGLGLSLCKNIVESHGGLIELKSEQGQGTAATITLPVYLDKGARADE